MKYSQNNEEHFILKCFENINNGKLLDIGAYDGITFSNVRKLLELGWEGILIEASPKVFTLLQENTKKLNVELINACIIDNKEELIDFYDNDQATATYEMDNYNKWKNKTPFTKIHMNTCNYQKILLKFGHHYDFVNIDVEGGSVRLFLKLFLLMPTVKCWCVEHDGNIDLIKSYIGDKYKIVHQNGENLIIVKNEL